MEFLEDFNLWQIPRILAGLSCYVVRFGLILFGIGVVSSGIFFVVSRGNPESLGRAKKTLKYVLIGGLVVFGVQTIVLTVASFLGAPSMPWIPWSCSTIFTMP